MTVEAIGGAAVTDDEMMIDPGRVTRWWNPKQTTHHPARIRREIRQSEGFRLAV